LAKKKYTTIQEMATAGGKARAKSMTKEERSAGAKKAANARWAALKEKKGKGAK
jgi:hypothetical protein